MKDLPCIFTVYVILALYVFLGVSREVVGGNNAVNVETRGLVHVYEEVETFHQFVDEVRRILPMDNWSVRVARKATTLGGDDIFCRLKAKQIEPLFDGQARGRRAIPRYRLPTCNIPAYQTAGGVCRVDFEPIRGLEQYAIMTSGELFE